MRLPSGAIQPQVAHGESGSLHIVYYSGAARSGDIFYAQSTDGGATLTAPVPVNNPGSAIAAGTIRGAQMAVGRRGRVHVAWNGSSSAQQRGIVNPDSGKRGEPMLYSRVADGGRAFEQQRNVMLHSFGLDGGGSVAADAAGNVFVVWHGIGETEARGDKTGEARRRVWIAKSRDEGRTFSREQMAWAEATGACGCCGLKAFAAPNGALYILYRSATESIHRDVYLLASADRGGTFQGRLLHKWEINACPMSSMDFAAGGDAIVGAWETAGQVYWAPVDGRKAVEPTAAPGEGKGRKHPRVAMNEKGDLLLAWTEGTGWARGGSLCWQAYDRKFRPAGEGGRVPGIPAWSFAAPFANTDGTFSILY